MARTFRRKKATYNYGWLLRDSVFVHSSEDGEWTGYGRYLKHIKIDQHSPKGKRKLANYHSDAGFGQYGHGSAPHWYRRMLNNKASGLEQQHLHRWKKLGDDLYEVPKPTRVRDAGWYW